MKLDNFFERIYLISLPHRQDRRDAFYKRLHALGLNWSIDCFAAFHGAKLGLPEPFERPGAGAFGCYLSHLAILCRCASDDCRNFLVFEDDAFLEDNFVSALEDSLQELPEDWDQLYLGFQPWNEDKGITEVVSAHLYRPFNANRTHAMAFNAKAYQRVIKHLTSLQNKPAGFHIDHWLGELHEERNADGSHVFNVYATRPQIVSQAGGRSDITGLLKERELWKVVREKLEEKKEVKKVEYIEITNSAVGYGALGRNGDLGYEGRRVSNYTQNKQFLSIHAPGFVTGKHASSVKIKAVLAPSGSPHVPIECFVNGEKIGDLSRTERTTKEVTLPPGEIKLEFKTPDNRAAHTYFEIEGIEEPVIEIYCNSQCPRNCAGCNQSELMKQNPSYEYTLEDAEALVKAIEKSGKYYRLCFTGGEPYNWKSRDKVMKRFSKSKNIIKTWVVTSKAEEKEINKLKLSFDRVCVSMRTDTRAAILAKPLHLIGCTVWDQTKHALPGTCEPVTDLDCCCRGQGIVASVIGQEVYPCVVAKNLQLDGKWPGLKAQTLEDYFENGLRAGQEPYPACKICVNNLKYRERCQQAEV